MRLEEFDTKYSLKYISGDIQSMREALKDYTRLIGSGEAFEDSYCVAHFEHQGEPISMDYFNEHQELIDYLEKNSPFFNINSGREDIQSSTTGEALFFLCAAMHPELEIDMKETCEAITAFSRKLNDSSEMWLTCESPFGVEALQITATKYPKYGYLLAGFLIPYWDDEHMPEALYSLGNWSSKLGITEDTMKAFCYCDNSRAREGMLGYDTWNGGYKKAIEGSKFDLLSHFKENPGEYEKFKDILVERYREMPYLQYCDDERYYEMNPTRGLITDILYLHYPYETWRDDHDMDEWLTNRFINIQADEAIMELKSYVEERLGRPIVSKEEMHRHAQEKKSFEVMLQQKSNNSTNELSETDKMKNIFLILPNGEELWEYVTENTSKECLNKIAPLDLIAKQKFFELISSYSECDTIEISLDDVENDMDDLMDGELWFLIYDFSEERKKNYFMRDATLLSDNETFRVYDVLHRILGSPILPRKILKVLKGSFIHYIKDEIEEIIKKRYSTTWINRGLEILRSISELEYYHGRSNLFEELQELYEMIEGNRHEDKEVILEWFDLEEPAKKSGYAHRWMRGYIRAGGHTLIAMFIAWKDQEGEKFDEITKAARIYIEKYAPKIIYSHLTSKAKWPKIEIMDNIEEYTDETRYQASYIDEIRRGYELWKPLERYLVTGRFKDETPKESFDVALSYLRKYLSREDEGISEKQPHYECFDCEEESSFYVIIAYLSMKIESLTCSDLLERSLKLGFSLAPMKLIKLLKDLNSDLNNPGDLPKYLKALDEMKNIGLSDDVYWAVQLKDLHNNISLRRIDIEKLKEHPSDPSDRERKHYLRLLKLYTSPLVPEMEITDPLWLIVEDVIKVQEALIEGTQLLDLRYRANYITNAIKLFGANNCYQNMIDRLAIDKVKKELEKNLNTPVNYYKEYLDMVGVSYREERLSLENMTQEYLIELGVEPISDERYLKLKEFYENDESGWVQQCIVKEEGKLKTLYNLEALSFAAEAKRRGDKSYVATFFILFIDRECPTVHEEAVPKTVEVVSSSKTDRNFRNEALEAFTAFLNGKAEIDSINVLLKCAVNEYGFFDGVGWYNGVQIDEIFSYLSVPVQKLVLSILSGVSHEKLKKVLKSENEDRYLDFMIDELINPNDLFNYLVNNGKKNHLVKLAKKRDCSAYIRSAKVNEMVNALAYIGGTIPKYYPLIVELREHKSIKVKAIAEKLIEICRIDINDPSPYKTVDYGIYRMEKANNLVEGKEGVTREAAEPYLIEKTTKIKAEIGMYIGLRFTAKNPETLSKVCHQRIIVTHPYRDRDGRIGKTQTKWNQNGYNDSKIFLGWYFEEIGELIPGDYTFEAYDTSGGLIVSKKFVIEV